MSAVRRASLTAVDPARTATAILVSISVCHLLNDMLQSLLPAIYPMLKSDFALDFSQIGLIALTSQMTASVLQPVVGLCLDRKPWRFSLAVGMGFTLVGLVLLATAVRFGMVLAAAGLVGLGSSIFHPESSRVARLASGGRHGLAQSLFQTGGNTGSAIGPLAAALVILPYGRESLAWFTIVALAAIVLLWRIGLWAHARVGAAAKATSVASHVPLPARTVRRAIAVLLALVFSKYLYLASLTSYYTFFLIQKFHVSVQSAQVHLFIFLGAAAVGTFAGGPIGDRIGRKRVIWASILGALPFTLLLPYANLLWTTVLTIVIGLVISSAFSAILVFATELIPGKVGLVAGLFFGFAFGIAALGSAALGVLADHTSIEFIYRVCAVLPAIGLLTALLPDHPDQHDARDETAEGQWEAVTGGEV
jgi:FSR family fosmidomycin resistance protein-like MFS transporter